MTQHFNESTFFTVVLREAKQNRVLSLLLLELPIRYHEVLNSKGSPNVARTCATASAPHFRRAK